MKPMDVRGATESMRPDPNPDALGEYELWNRTGVGASPEEAAAQAEGVAAIMGGDLPPPTPIEGSGLVVTRASYEIEAHPIGTMPPPMIDAADDEDLEVPAVLLDKLSERCAFERSGTRLYEGLIGKLQVRGTFEGGPTEEKLREFMEAELRHFQLVASALTALGGDPTAMSPCANVSAVASQGLVQVISDPRTTLAQALQAILIAELADNDGWAMLIEITREAGQEEIAASFEEARREEDEHLLEVRAWLAAHARLAAVDPEIDAHGDGNVSPLS